jgi:hypothetical protein
LQCKSISVLLNGSRIALTTGRGIFAMNSAAEAICILVLVFFGASGLADYTSPQYSRRLNRPFSTETFVFVASKLACAIHTELNEAWIVSIRGARHLDSRAVGLHLI